MNEYFCVTNSFAAPFFSDTDFKYIKADSPEEATDILIKGYKHPMGLYSARIYKSADAYHKNEKCVAEWLSEKAREDYNKE